MDFSKLAKLGKATEREEAAQTGERLTAIVKVSTPGYRPAQVEVRKELGPLLFTAELLASDLDALKRDPSVVEVSPAKRLPLQKLPAAQRYGR
ncbi:MAG TPA: hypothetical protein VFX59_10720 [Polyangiales bacterium]|nr:hypothetical protein [Polyangiales bacterium]